MASLIDIKAFHIQSDGQVVQALANEETAGETVDGATKLTQKFWILLMEQKGSVPYLPAQGTIFMNRFLTGQFVDDADVFVNFSAAMVDIRPQLENTETVDDPPDEQYVRGVIEKIFITPDEILVQARVETQESEGMTFLLPLRFLVR
jgi:hypothetical protein